MPYRATHSSLMRVALCYPLRQRAAPRTSVVVTLADVAGNLRDEFSKVTTRSCGLAKDATSNRLPTLFYGGSAFVSAPAHVMSFILYSHLLSSVSESRARNTPSVLLPSSDSG